MIDIYPEAGSGVVITGAYGELYVADNAATQTLTLQSQWYQWTTGWVVGEANSTVPSAVGGNITVSVGGVFRVSCAMSLGVTGNNQKLEVAIFKNGAYQADHSLHAIFATADIVPFTLSGILTLAIGDVIDLRIRNETSPAKVLTVSDANLNCSQI